VLPEIDLSELQPFIELTLAFIGAYLLALWISLAIWTFRDIRSRSNDILLVLLATLLVLIFSIPGLILYMILRPPETLAEATERTLAEEAMLQELDSGASCPQCKQRIEPDFLVCPSCANVLRRRCPTCKHVLQLSWGVCPYCARPVAVAPEAPVQQPG
jgi:hypothetical protein